MAEFNANLASQRQAALCRWIGDNLRDNAGAHLKPLGWSFSLELTEKGRRAHGLPPSEPETA